MQSIGRTSVPVTPSWKCAWVLYSVRWSQIFFNTFKIQEQSKRSYLLLCLNQRTSWMISFKKPIILYIIMNLYQFILSLISLCLSTLLPLYSQDESQEIGLTSWNNAYAEWTISIVLSTNGREPSELRQPIIIFYNTRLKTILLSSTQSSNNTSKKFLHVIIDCVFPFMIGHRYVQVCEFFRLILIDEYSFLVTDK